MDVLLMVVQGMVTFLNIVSQLSQSLRNQVLLIVGNHLFEGECGLGWVEVVIILGETGKLLTYLLRDELSRFLHEIIS